MTETIATGICAVLETMPGFPSWQGKTGEKLFERFMDALDAVPDGIGLTMVGHVDRHFDTRPSVKALLEWAWTLTPARPFRIEETGHARLTGPAEGERTGSCPQRLRDEMRAFFARKHAEDAARRGTASTERRKPPRAERAASALEAVFEGREVPAK